MLYICLILILSLGIFILTYSFMEDFYMQCIERIIIVSSRFKGNMEEIAGILSTRSKGEEAWNHLKVLLQLTYGLGTDISVRFFIIISGLFGSIVMVLLSGKVETNLVILSTLAAIVLPYTLLTAKLKNIRVKSSREGEILLTELVNNYKIHYYNMQEAIDVTAFTIEEAPNVRRLLFNLSRGLKRSGSDIEIHNLLEEFRLSLNTNWGNCLSNAMYFALTSGIEVTEALDDIGSNIKEARKLDEFKKRENSEAGLMLKYMAPLTYVLSIIGGVRYFDLSISEYLHYQFNTGVGLTWMTISLLVYISGLIINNYITKSKLDF